MKENLLQQIIAHSMYTGSLLADKNYGGEIGDPDSKSFIASLEKLKELVTEFIGDNHLEYIDIETIFPLYKEIETILS